MDAHALLESVTVGIATASLSVTLSRGKIFRTARLWIKRRNTWLGNLIQCPYCTSHWVAALFTLVYHPRPLTAWVVTDFAVALFCAVTTSAVLVGIITSVLVFNDDEEA